MIIGLTVGGSAAATGRPEQNHRRFYAVSCNRVLDADFLSVLIDTMNDLQHANPQNDCRNNP